MENNKCIFCGIIEGELPSYKIFENEHVYAFLDIHPVNKGHILIAPKRHVENLYVIPNDILKEVAVALKKVSIAAKKGTGADGINIEMNNEAPAGQIIDHAHLHIVPRYEGDGLKHWPGKEFSEADMKETAERIAGALAA